MIPHLLVPVGMSFYADPAEKVKGFCFAMNIINKNILQSHKSPCLPQKRSASIGPVFSSSGFLMLILILLLILLATRTVFPGARMLGKAGEWSTQHSKHLWIGTKEENSPEKQVSASPGNRRAWLRPHREGVSGGNQAFTISSWKGEVVIFEKLIQYLFALKTGSEKSRGSQNLNLKQGQVWNWGERQFEEEVKQS